MEYKEILKGIVNIINTTEKSDIGFANICTYIGENCPELKESEDERIRKEIIAVFKGQTAFTTEEDGKKYIAWLEKQGVSKSYWKPTEEQYEALTYAYNSCSDTERGNYYEGVLGTLIEDLHKLDDQHPKFRIGDAIKKKVQVILLQLAW